MKLITIILAGIIWNTSVAAETLRLAVTTSFDNSGLADVLLPEIKTDTGLDIQLLVVGTGQALRLGASGDVDAVLVHSRAAEDAFVAQDHGTHRREIMYNDFVILGPKTDPAEISDTVTLTAAMTQLADNSAVFVSRGDESGTHNAEKRLWAMAASDPATFGPWYRSVGAGMGTALNTASAMNAYILSDRASWLNFKNKGSLEILFEGDPALFNQYTFMPVNPNKGHQINHRGALALEAWLTSNNGQQTIDNYTLLGSQLFKGNASQ